MRFGKLDPELKTVIEMDKPPWPTKLRLTEQGRNLEILFDSGEVFSLSAEYLRVTSPSVEVRGHSPSEKKVIAGKRSVAVLALKPVGSYAVLLEFDDKHASGIYSWDYLHRLGADREQIWHRYIEELAKKGLSR